MNISAGETKVKKLGLISQSQDINRVQLTHFLHCAFWYQDGESAFLPEGSVLVRELWR